MNTFDAVIAAFALLAIVMGFNAGLLRSLATILGYLIAAPLAVALAPYVIPFAFGHAGAAPANAWTVVVLVFVALGIAISALLRVIVEELSGDDIGLFDRVAGAALGAVRIFLRSRHSGRPRAVVSRRLEAEASSFRGRACGSAVAAARGSRRRSIG